MASLQVGISLSASLTSQTGDYAAVRMVVREAQGSCGRLKPQQTLSLPGQSLPSGKPSHLPDASDPPVTHVHLKRSPGHSAVLCYPLWLQPQWKLENRNHTCLALHSIPLTVLC